MLYRKKTGEWLRFETKVEGMELSARINVTHAGRREPIEPGEWILCQKAVGGVPGDETAPYDVSGIRYDAAVLEGIDGYQRVFRYGSGKYAYTAVVIPRADGFDRLFLVLSMTFFEKNPNPRVRRKSLRWKEKRFFATVFRVFSAFVPKRGNRVLFLKENGTTPTENMRALLDRLVERGLDKDFRIVCRYRNIFGGKQRALEWLRVIYEISRADYIFIDDYAPVFGFIRPDRRTVLTQIWHAGVGFKSVGYARFGIAGSPDPYASSHRAYTYALVGNENLRETYSEVFGVEQEALLATGMPRLDHFLDEDRVHLAKERLVGEYPWMGGGRVLVFAPTFRGTGQATAYYPYDSFFDMDELYEMCERTDSYFIFEIHHFVKDPPPIPDAYKGRLFDLSHENLNDLFHVADVLITDYSSCFYDYLLLRKPLVFYAPDKVEYSAIRGMQRSMDEMAPGIVCETFEELMDVLRKGSYDEVKPRASSIDRCAEGGMLASDRVIDFILLGKDVSGVRLDGGPDAL